MGVLNSVTYRKVIHTFRILNKERTFLGVLGIFDNLFVGHLFMEMI